MCRKAPQRNHSEAVLCTVCEIFSVPSEGLLPPTLGHILPYLCGEEVVQCWSKIPNKFFGWRKVFPTTLPCSYKFQNQECNSQIPAPPPPHLLPHYNVRLKDEKKIITALWHLLRGVKWRLITAAGCAVMKLLLLFRKSHWWWMQFCFPAAAVRLHKKQLMSSVNSLKAILLTGWRPTDKPNTGRGWLVCRSWISRLCTNTF